MPKWKPLLKTFLRFPEILSVHVFSNLLASLEKCWVLLLLFTQIIISATLHTAQLSSSIISLIWYWPEIHGSSFYGQPKIIINIIKLLLDLLVHLINVTVARNSYSRFWSHAAVLLLVGDKRRARQECCPQTHHHQHHHPPTAHPQVEQMEEILCNLLKGVNWRLPSHYVKDSPLPSQPLHLWHINFKPMNIPQSPWKGSCTKLRIPRQSMKSWWAQWWRPFGERPDLPLRKLSPPPSPPPPGHPLSIPIHCTFYVHYEYIIWGLLFRRYVMSIMHDQKRKLFSWSAHKLWPTMYVYSNLTCSWCTKQ